MMLRKLNVPILYPFLLPLFFVVHGVQENYGFIPAGAAILLCLTYLAAAILIFFICRWFFRSPDKAALMTTALLSFYFFFGAVHDYLDESRSLHSLARYSILLPGFLAGTILLALFLKFRTFKGRRLANFLAVLFLVYILIDFLGITVKAIRNDPDKLSVYSFSKGSPISNCTRCPKPDIYFLLFDEYASSKALREQYHYDNGDLDTFLLDHGFQIQKSSRSNYNFTPFSMASLLNMSYLKGIEHTEAVTVADYARCNSLIRNNAVISFLSAQGYDIVNLSIFDLAGNPSAVDQDFLPLKTKLITDRTLFARLYHDIGWMLYTGRFEIKWLSGNLMFRTLKNNEKFIRQVKEVSAVKAPRPRFVYLHVLMPHPPFYMDADGRLKDNQTIAREFAALPAQAYLDYLPYTNKQLKDIVSTIQKNTGGQAVIVFMGDHGFRKNAARLPYFQNQNAVYIPGATTRPLYDSVSNVNEFRLLFNHLFHQQLPLLKDSCIFLKDN